MKILIGMLALVFGCSTPSEPTGSQVSPGLTKPPPSDGAAPPSSSELPDGCVYLYQDGKPTAVILCVNSSTFPYRGDPAPKEKGDPAP